MKKNKEALRPMTMVPPTIQELIKKKIVAPSDEETILAQGSETAFWTVLHTQFENTIQQLEEINDQAIANGLPFDEIGRNALVISQVKGIIRRITNSVKDARELADEKQSVPETG